MARRHRHHHRDPEQRRGYYGGVYGTTYALTGGYLNPDQFGYTTAQAGGLGDTAQSGDASAGASGGGGDAGAGGGAA